MIAVPKYPAFWLLALLAAVLLPPLGCSRARYRLNADREVTYLVTEKSVDPRWAIRNFNIGIDPRSRFFDPYNPDREPMPPDDPAAHQFMHYVGGMRGYRRWHAFGNSPNLQNPTWQQQLSSYVPTTPDGKILLNLENSIRLTYIHSPDYRLQLETLYLSAVDVSTERWRFATQFYGGIGPNFTEEGRGISGTGASVSQLSVDNTHTTGQAPGFVSNGGINTNIAPQSPRWQFQKQLATGGQVLVGFANSFVWQFAGSDTNNSFSILNFNLVQPLLRAGSRAVVLEQLTIAERNLMYNLRAMMRYRQGVFTNVAVGDFSGVTDPQRVGGFTGGTGLTGFSGQGSGGLGGVGQATSFGRAGFTAATNATGAVASGTGFAGGGAAALGGFLGLLQQLQQIRNTQDSLNLQLRTLALLEANFNAGLIDIQQVDTFRQNIQTERANLLQSAVSLQNSKDTFIRQLIGFPPSLPWEVDDSMIQQFRFIDAEVRGLEDETADFIAQVGKTEAEPPIEQLLGFFDEFARIRPKLLAQFAEVHDDLQKMQAVAPTRLKLIPESERPQLEAEQLQLGETLKQLEDRFNAGDNDLQALRERLRPDNRAKVADELVAQAASFSKLTQELSLVQARARLETVTIEPIEMAPEEALEIARAARQDWMNNVATVVDTWRLITYNANALQSNLTVTFGGQLGTTGNNPLNFNGTQGELNAGLRFDPPFTRLLERNNYRQALINYQQDRRTLIQFEDGINQVLRQDLRYLRQLKENLEIQRKAVAIAVRRVDKTLEDLNQPPPPIQPGQPAIQLGPTAAFNLLTAISDLRNAQNNFLGVWLNFYSERVQFHRDLGVMQVDEQGMWIDLPIREVIARLETAGMLVVPGPIPPAIPQDWLKNAGLGGAIAEGFEPLTVRPDGEKIDAPPPDAQPAPDGASLPREPESQVGNPNSRSDVKLLSHDSAIQDSKSADEDLPRNDKLPAECQPPPKHWWTWWQWRNE